VAVAEPIVDRCGYLRQEKRADTFLRTFRFGLSVVALRGHVCIGRFRAGSGFTESALRTLSYLSRAIIGS
jgi:hypothetical protein